MNILYLGDYNNSSTSFHRGEALSRLGHSVISLDPYIAFNSLVPNKFKRKFHYYTGYRYIQTKIAKWIDNSLKNISHIDLIWVNSGELIGKCVVEHLKVLNTLIILYNNDDVTGHRDGKRFFSLKTGISLYDMCVVVREMNVSEYKRIGARKVFRVTMSYDEIAHMPLDSTSEIHQSFKSDIAFIGTWIRGEDRDKFLLGLINEGVPVSIWGNRWHLSPYWSKLKPFHRGSSLSGKDYVAAIQGAKVCLGFLSKGNRDRHTTRSLEIPFAGGLLCAERTTEHLEMYNEGEEAVFWSDVNECAQICKDLLSNAEKRENIRLAGMVKVRRLKVGNEDICQKILNELSTHYQVSI